MPTWERDSLEESKSFGGPQNTQHILKEMEKNVLQIVLGIAEVYTVKSHFISVRDLKASCRQTCNLDLAVLFT